MKICHSALIVLTLALSSTAYAQSNSPTGSAPIASRPPVSLLPAPAVRRGNAAKANARATRPATPAIGPIKTDQTIAAR